MTTQWYANPADGHVIGYGDGATPPVGWSAVPAPTHGRDIWDFNNSQYIPQQRPLMTRLTVIIEAMPDDKVAKFMGLIGSAPVLIDSNRLVALQLAVASIIPADAAETTAKAAILAEIVTELGQ